MRTVAGLLVAGVVIAGCGGGNESGDRIAFYSDRDGEGGPDGGEIFVMNADGTEVRQLTDNDVADRSPAWSPNGKHIAFDSDRYGDWEIFVMNADGTDVYSTGQKGRQPSWGG